MSKGGRNLVTLSRLMDEAGFPAAFDYNHAACWWEERTPPPGRKRLRVTDEELQELRDLLEKVAGPITKPPVIIGEERL